MAERPYFQVVADYILEKKLEQPSSFTTHDISERVRIRYPDHYYRSPDYAMIGTGIIRALHTMNCLTHVKKYHYAFWEIRELPTTNTEKDWRNAIGKEEKAKVTPCGSCNHTEATIIGSAYAYACPLLEHFMQK